jgi:hypothetical protein
MRWAWHIACRNIYTSFWWGNLREGDNLEDIKLDCRIILKWIFKKWNGGMNWIDLAREWGRRLALLKNERNRRCS